MPVGIVTAEVSSSRNRREKEDSEDRSNPAVYSDNDPYLFRFIRR
jgi:hypothetical protein